MAGSGTCGARLGGGQKVGHPLRWGRAGGWARSLRQPGTLSPLLTIFGDDPSPLLVDLVRWSASMLSCRRAKVSVGPHEAAQILLGLP